MAEQKKAIIVNRVSSKKQNYNLQEKDCLEFAIKRNYLIIKTLGEVASAGKSKQKCIYEAEELAIKERADIIVWKYDRPFRNKKDFAEFMERMYLLHNIKVYSVQEEWVNMLWEIAESFDSSKIPYPYNESIKEQLKSNWKLMVRIIGKMAEDEIKDKGARVKLAVVKDKELPTKSYKGNKWGRKALSIEVINKVMELHQQNKSIREISKLVTYWDKNNHQKNISIASVHKLLTRNKQIQPIAENSVNNFKN